MVRAFLFLWLLLLSSITAFPQQQDIFSYKSSLRYSNYLMKSQQFELATYELDRLVFMNPTKDSLKFELIRAFRSSGKYDQGLRKIEGWYPNDREVPGPLVKEHYRLLLLNNFYSETITISKKDQRLEEKDRYFFRLNAHLMSADWSGAQTYFKEQPEDLRSQFPAQKSLVVRSEELRYKSSALALGLSTVVPGLGKVYTGDWKDAIISFITVGAFSWQAYRGFDRQGLDSGYGWVFAGLGAGFHLGNIYGSFKSARTYNRKLDSELQQKAKDLFTGSF